jgi:pimeloyl-ACP methyl ester carboxylesterase
MPTAQANGIELEYDTRGDPGAPPLLLVMGLGAQMTAWDDELCDQLAAAGFFVVRFDNRDVGLSTKIESADGFDIVSAIGAALSGGTPDAPYLLRDMADDAFGLLDHLGIERAHVVGASMGGMIAQTMAITRPERVATLTSIMSTTGDPTVGTATPEALAILMTRPPSSRDEYVTNAIGTSRLLHGGVLPFDERRAAERAAAFYDRCFYPAGVGRQLVAIMASGDRTGDLAGCRIPTLVVHGDADPLVDHSGGVATAKAVPEAELLTIEGMGHDLPVEKWGEVVDAVVAHTAKAQATPAREPQAT